MFIPLPHTMTLLTTPRCLFDTSAEIKSEESLEEKVSLEVNQWLEELELTQYYVNFMENDFDSLEIVRQIEDKATLAEMGILSIGHQVKIMRAIRDLQPKKEESLCDEEGYDIAITDEGYEDQQ